MATLDELARAVGAAAREALPDCRVRARVDRRVAEVVAVTPAGASVCALGLSAWRPDAVDGAELDYVETSADHRRQGRAEALLRAVTTVLDTYQIPCTLTVCPYSRADRAGSLAGPVSAEDLGRWYARHGFRAAAPDGGSHARMRREPARTACPA